MRNGNLVLAAAGIVCVAGTATQLPGPFRGEAQKISPEFVEMSDRTATFLGKCVGESLWVSAKFVDTLSMTVSQTLGYKNSPQIDPQPGTWVYNRSYHGPGTNL